eukprot:2967941-Lingulodinium_polyedra.AAC.1
MSLSGSPWRAHAAQSTSASAGAINLLSEWRRLQNRPSHKNNCPRRSMANVLGMGPIATVAAQEWH